MASRIRVVLVDDHRMFRLGLRNIIDGSENMEVVGEASNGLEAIDAVRRIRPDVVVMDINMPKMNGIQATQQIKKSFPDTAVIGHSMQTQREVIQHMQSVGISSFVNKESAVEELCSAIEKAVAPKGGTSPPMAELKVPRQR
jgi:DNA-binding NarL/FixJ family response regulator